MYIYIYRSRHRYIPPYNEVTSNDVLLRASRSLDYEGDIPNAPFMLVYDDKFLNVFQNLETKKALSSIRKDYEKFGKWLFQDVILNEIDDYKIQNGIKTYDTSTNYATHLRTNENWKTRRAMFRENFLLSLTRLVEDGEIKILDNKEPLIMAG